MNESAESALFTTEQVRALDQLSAKAQGIETFDLMRNAGNAAYSHMIMQWPEARNILILAGPGNNGGDGYILGLASLAGRLSVLILQIGNPDVIRGDARRAREQFIAAGGSEQPFDGNELPACDLIVDALFGTGLNKPLHSTGLSAVRAINRHPAPVLALDIPSGLGADTGMPINEAVIAQRTVTFVGRKRGMFTGLARNHCGLIAFDALGTRDSIHEQVKPSARLMSLERLRQRLPARRACAHKGEFGHALIVGGDLGMGGAARLAGEAALRCGAGRVSIATRAHHASQLIGGCPELMSHGVESLTEMDALLTRTTVIAIGPGLGNGDWGQALLSAVLKQEKPLVLDADALNLLASDPIKHPRWILTPHPGEAARLLACRASDIQTDRYAAAKELQSRFGGTIVLKGAGSIVQSADRTTVCPFGNEGMATAGMGDVLTGIIAALLAQGLSPTDAAELGVVLHARAGDMAAKQDGPRGMAASDLFAHLRHLVN